MLTVYRDYERARSFYERRGCSFAAHEEDVGRGGVAGVNCATGGELVETSLARSQQAV